MAGLCTVAQWSAAEPGRGTAPTVAWRISAGACRGAIGRIKNRPSLMTVVGDDNLVSIEFERSTHQSTGGGIVVGK